MSSNRNSRDLPFGIATLAVSAGYYWAATVIPTSQLADAIGPQGLPTTYAILLALLSVILIARSVAQRARESRQGAATAPRDRHGRISWRVAGMLGMGVVYIVVAPWLGYAISIAALILATTYYQGGAINRQVVMVAVGGAIFFWLLFVVMMRIPQPPGWWAGQ